jgi:hypothetical protein
VKDQGDRDRIGWPPAIQAAIEDARARVRIGYPWWLRPFLARDVVAVTLGRRIFVRTELAARSFERLMLHELEHVRQVNRLGLLPFLWRYLTEFARHWVRLRSLPAAYAAISFEVEARRAEEEIPPPRLPSSSGAASRCGPIIP